MIIKPAPSGGSSGTSGAFKTGHGIVMSLTIELIGIGIMAAIADSTSPAIGRMMVALMAGWFLIWFLTNSSYFNSIVGKASKYESA